MISSPSSITTTAGVTFSSAKTETSEQIKIQNDIQEIKEHYSMKRLKSSVHQ